MYLTTKIYLPWDCLIAFQTFIYTVCVFFSFSLSVISCVGYSTVCRFDFTLIYSPLSTYGERERGKKVYSLLFLVGARRFCHSSSLLWRCSSMSCPEANSLRVQNWRDKIPLVSLCQWINRIAGIRSGCFFFQAQAFLLYSNNIFQLFHAIYLAQGVRTNTRSKGWLKQNKASDNYTVQPLSRLEFVAFHQYIIFFRIVSVQPFCWNGNEMSVSHLKKEEKRGKIAR